MSKPKQKVLFTTIGATASFPSLIKAVLTPSFLRAASNHGYTKLIIQFGQGGEELFKESCVKAQKEGPYGLTVEGFDLTDDMMVEMRVVKAGRERDEGVVLCHAGMIHPLCTSELCEKRARRIGEVLS